MMGKTSLRFIYKTCNIEGISESEYKEVCYLFNKSISKHIINKGYKFKLPGSIGTISVAKNKMKYEKLHFDYAQWKKTGVKSYHLNEHSDNYYAFVRWNKKGAVLPNKFFYGFKFTRENTREITKVMKEENGHQLYEIANKKDAI
jgi:hypothetical protein